MDENIRRLGALSVRVDRTNSVVRLAGRGNLSGWGIDLYRLESVNACVVGLGLADIDTEGKGDNLSNVSIGTEDADGNTQALSEQAHSLQALLVVGTTATNEDLDLVGDQLVLELLESTDNALEGSSDIGEVSNTTTDDQDLALGVRCAAGDKID